MSPATTMAPPAASGKTADKQPALLVPFTRAAKEHTEQMFDVNVTLGASSTQLQPIDVPAYGFARYLTLLITASGGTGAGAVGTADAPWSAIHELSLMDVNGAPIVGPISGYDLYLINKYGGYGWGDPKLNAGFTAISGTGGNFTYLVRVPIEISGRDALGALANQNQASTYKLRITAAQSSAIFSTPPATLLPTLKIQGWLDAWTQPLQQDLRGNGQATNPPAHGTTQFWSKAQMALAGAGQQTFRQTRVGQHIRNLILVARDGSGVRTNTPLANPLTLAWDTRVLHEHNLTVWREVIARRFGLSGVAALDSAGGLDTGVLVEDFCHEFDGRAGYELRDGWLPTVQSTRLDFYGVWGGAGQITALVNDVSPAGEVYV